MDMRVAKSDNIDGSVEVYLVHVNHWDDFDTILSLLQQDSNCKIVSNNELIYMRIAELSLNDSIFELRHDDMLGNFFYTKQPEQVPLLEQLAQSVIDSIVKKIEAKENI